LCIEVASQEELWLKELPLIPRQDAIIIIVIIIIIKAIMGTAHVLGRVLM